jgi:uncharacterized protein (TIGR03435 family)
MTETLMRMAVSLSDFTVLSLLTKATFVVALGLIIVRAASRSRASMRHLVLAVTFAALLALPVVVLLVPPVNVPVGRPRVAAPAPGALIPRAGLPRGERRPPIIPDVAASASPARLSASTILGAVWVLGTALTLLSVALTPWQLRRLRRSARPWPQGGEVARALAVERGITRPVTVLLHQQVSSPMVCGLISPTIVLPSDAVEWSDAEIARATIHELTHVRRADWPVHLATRAVCSLYWFHPLVWIAWRQLRLEAERACDDSVLHTAERTDYAQQLVTLARRHAMSLPALSMACRSDLSARVAAVLDSTQARGPVGVWRACAVVSLAGVLTASVAPLRAASPQAVSQVAKAQAAQRPSFEVASVRQNTSGRFDQYFRTQGDQVTITNFPLWVLILRAYQLQPFQLVGGPPWLRSDRWDIVAKAPAGTPRGSAGPGGAPDARVPDAMQLMAQSLLEERFKLAIRVETRELPIYRLVLARRDGQLGPRLRRSTLDCEALRLARARGDGPPSPDQGPRCGGGGAPGRLFGTGTTIANLARVLSGEAGRAVEDRTGLDGLFDFDIEFTPVNAPAGGGGVGTAPERLLPPSKNSLPRDSSHARVPSR